MTPNGDLTSWRVEVQWGTESIIAPPMDILSQPTIEHLLEPTWRDGISLRLAGGAQVRLRAGSPAATRLLQLTEAEFWETPIVRLLHGEDSVPVFRGTLDRIENQPGALHLVALLDCPWSPRRPLCRNLADLPTGRLLGVTEDTWLPQVFGMNDGVPAPLLHRVSAARLREEVTPTTSEILLRAPVDWPFRGRVQIADEVIEYTACRSDPPRLQGLQRPQPRTHPRTSVVALLPHEARGLRWIAADHPAEVLAVRAESRDGPRISGLACAEENLDGRTACILQADRFPVLREHAPWAIAFDPEPDRENWELLAETLALWSNNLFLPSGSPRGARLSTAYPQVAARWVADFTQRVNRHDKLDALRLSFAISASAGWGDAMFLQVRIENDRGTIERQIGFADLLSNRGDFTGNGRIEEVRVADRASIATGPECFVLPFDEVDAPGWSDAPQAISGPFSTHAFGDSVPLLARIHRLPIPSPRGIERLALLARVRAAGAPCTVQLSASLPGRFEHIHAQGVNENWQTIGVWFDAYGVAPEELLEAAALFRLALPAGGRVEVAGFWLEAQLPPQTPTATDQVLGAQVKVAGSVRLAMAFQPCHVDVTELLDPADPWSILGGGSASPRVTLRIINAGTVFSVEVLALTWTAAVHPATRVALATTLFTQQRGRLTEDDGACSPTDVIALLHRHGDFASLPPESLDEASREAASVQLQALNRRYGAWFAERLSVRQAILHALAESACVPVPQGNTWQLHLLDRDPELQDPELFDESNVLEFPKALRISKPSFEARELVFVGPRGEVHDDACRTLGEGAARWHTRWLRFGFESLGRTIFERFGIPDVSIALPTAIEHLGLPLWKESRVAAHEWGTESRVGHVICQDLREGRLEITHRLLGRRVSCWSDDGASLRRDITPPRLVVLIAGRIVARFTDEYLELRGQVIEDAQELPSTAEALTLIDEGLVLRTGAAAIAINGDGDLLVPGTVSEVPFLTEDPPPNGYELRPPLLVLGTPELGTVAVLNQTTGRLSVAGSIVERALII